MKIRDSVANTYIIENIVEDKGHFLCCFHILLTWSFLILWITYNVNYILYILQGEILQGVRVSGCIY